MKYSKIKISAFVIFTACFFIILGISACKAQAKTAPYVEPLLSQTPPATSTKPPTSTFPSPSVTMLENLFGDSSCSWPCWQGITPAITTSTEALRILQNSPLIQKHSIQSNVTGTEISSLDWFWVIGDKQPSGRGKIELSNGVVKSIDLGTYPIISVGEIINKFGSPEKIGIIDCRFIPEMPEEWCGTLYYRKYGFDIKISWRQSGLEDIQITPSDPIDSAVLSVPSFNDNWLSFKGFELEDWSGYGNLLDLYVK